MNDPQGLPGKPQCMHAGVSAINDIHEATIIGRNVIRLDDLGADVRDAIERTAPQIGIRGDGGDVECDLLRIVRIAHVDGPHATVEVGDESNRLIEGRPELLVSRMWTEAPAAEAKAVTRCWNLEGRDRLGPALGGDVGHERQVAELAAECPACLRGNHHDVAGGTACIVPSTGYKVRHRHRTEWPTRVCPVVRIHDQASDFSGRIVSTGHPTGKTSFTKGRRQKLIAVDDLHDPVGTDPVREVNTPKSGTCPSDGISGGVGAGRDGAMDRRYRREVRWYHAARLLPVEGPIPDEYWTRRITQVEDHDVITWFPS